MNRSASPRALQWKYLPAAALAVMSFALLAGAAPAAAECTGTRLTIERPNATNFVCRANCGAVPNELLLARRDIYRTHDARYCMELCEERTDCRAISFEFLYEGGELITRCYLWREGELATFDDGVPIPRMRQPGVCYRRWAPYRDPRLEIETNRLGQDQMRPGVPGASLPKK